MLSYCILVMTYVGEHCRCQSGTNDQRQDNRVRKDLLDI